MYHTRLEEFLQHEKVPYQSIEHFRTYSSQRTAAAAHISGKEIAKSVMVSIKGKLCMVVLPANKQVDLAKLRKIAGTNEVRLVNESEFKDRFADCEVGAMPPFGNLYGMDMFVAEALAKDESIAFNAGTHTDLIKMAFKDYERVTHPKIVRVAKGN